MTELSFLIKLLLNDELPKTIKAEVAERIGEVEAELVHKPFANKVGVPIGNAGSSGYQGAASLEPPIPITPQASAALQARQEAMSKAGKIEPGRTSARKF